MKNKKQKNTNKNISDAESEDCVKIYSEHGILCKKVYLNEKGEVHREDGPAMIRYNILGKKIEEIYFMNGSRHRIDGPAYISYKDDVPCTTKFIIRGMEVSREYWEKSYFNQLSEKTKLKLLFDQKVV